MLLRYFLLGFVILLIPFSRKIRNLIVFVFRNHSSKVPTKTIEEFIRHKEPNKKTKVLFIFPHPDDETMATGGLVRLMSKDKRFEVILVSLTAGEEGKELLVKETPVEIARIRREEFKKAIKNLGVKIFEIWDFQDTKVSEKSEEIKKKINEYIKLNEIDSVVTYEKSGMYGHPDHVALSKFVKEISEENKTIDVIYSTLTEKLEKAISIRTRIKNLELHDYETNVQPDFKIMVVPVFFSKLRAARAYKSQKLSHRKELWEEIFSMPFEYYTRRAE